MNLKDVHFIVNPASGRPAPILHHINRACADAKVDWDISVTKEGRTAEAARRALDAGAGRIIVYGGDGTIADAASAVIGSEAVFGIIPGGTANVLSAELGIPRDIPQALSIALRQDPHIRRMDVGRINGHVFLLRVGFGLEAEIMHRADRQSKNAFGWLAYAVSGLSALLNTRETVYQFTVDGKDFRRNGMGLIVANSGNVGLPGLSFAADIDVADGQLDLILIRPADISQILEAQSASDAEKVELLGLFERWTGKDICITCDPPQAVQFDGEILDGHEVRIHLEAQALSVICGRSPGGDAPDSSSRPKP